MPLQGTPEGDIFLLKAKLRDTHDILKKLINGADSFEPLVQERVDVDCEIEELQRTWDDFISGLRSDLRI